MALVPGQWLVDWELGDELGAGGFAVVHAATHADGRSAAIKAFSDPRSVEALREHPEPLRLVHPCIVRTLEEHLEHDPPFLVLEPVKGGSLRDAMGGALTPERVVGLVSGLAAALDHAHDQGVLHLDLKPENVLLDDEGRPKLTDFGPLQAADPDHLRQSLLLTQELGIASTPDYAAPEVRNPARQAIDRRADVYGLAVLTFEMLTGQLPLGLDLPTQIDPTLPPALDELLAVALARDPGRRPLSAGAFAGRLRSALDPRTVAGPEEAPPPPPKRRPGLLVGALAVLATFALTWLGAHPASERAPHPRLEQLLSRAPAGARVGLLLPAEDLGASERGWARDAGELLADWPDSHSHVRLWAPTAELELLFERPQRDALSHTGRCELVLHAVIPPKARALADDSQLFLLDLPSYEVRWATPTTSEAARQVADKVGRVLRGSSGPLALLPTVDARLSVSNQSTAWLDAQLASALVPALPTTVPLRARAGTVSRLRSVSDARRGLSAELALKCVYDHEAQRLRVTLTRLPDAQVFQTTLEGVTLPDYEPRRGALTQSVDPVARSLVVHQGAEAVSTALEKARSLLYQRDPEAAQRVLETLRRRGPELSRLLEPSLLLAQAHADQGNALAALAELEATCERHPGSSEARAAYHRIGLQEARRLYRAGKRPWYGNDDEALFTAARALLERLDSIPRSEADAAELRALRTKVEGEL